MNGVIEQNKILVRSNSLVKASYNLTSNQQLFLYTVFSKLDQDKPVSSTKEYRVLTKDFEKAAGITYTAAYKALVDAARSLQKELLYLPNPEPNPKKRDNRITYSWVDKITPFSSEQDESAESGVYIKFGDSICPFLTLLKANFTKVPLNGLFELKGFYARRFYEYFYYLKFKGKRTKYLQISTIREMFNLDNKETKKSIHPQIGSFKKYVIDAAVNEINEKLDDLHISYETVKKGRKVDGYNFTYVFTEEVKGEVTELRVPKLKAKPEVKMEVPPPSAPPVEVKVKVSAAALRMKAAAEEVAAQKAEEERLAAEKEALDKLKALAKELGFENFEGFSNMGDFGK